MKRKVTKKSKRRLLLFGLPSLFIIVYFCMTLSSYVIGFSKLNKEEKTLNQELVNLQKEKVNLKNTITKLNDPDYIARYAKEYFLYSKDGEYIIKINSNEEKKETDTKSNNEVYVIILLIIGLFLSVIFLKKRKTHQD